MNVSSVHFFNSNVYYRVCHYMRGALISIRSKRRQHRYSVYTVLHARDSVFVHVSVNLRIKINADGMFSGTFTGFQILINHPKNISEKRLIVIHLWSVESKPCIKLVV